MEPATDPVEALNAVSTNQVSSAVSRERRHIPTRAMSSGVVIGPESREVVFRGNLLKAPPLNRRAGRKVGRALQPAAH